MSVTHHNTSPNGQKCASVAIVNAIMRIAPIASDRVGILDDTAAAAGASGRPAARRSRARLRKSSMML